MNSITSNNHKIKVKITNTKYLNINKPLTPKMLREAADQLEQEDISKIEFKTTGWGTERGCFIFRPETCAERQKREDREEKARIKKEEAIRKEKDALIKKAIALGMKVIE